MSGWMESAAQRIAADIASGSTAEVVGDKPIRHHVYIEIDGVPELYAEERKEAAGVRVTGAYDRVDLYVTSTIERASELLCRARALIAALDVPASGVEGKQ